MKCPVCNREVTELEEVCPRCGTNFEEYEKKSKDTNEENTELGKTFALKIVNIIQLVIFIIIAIVNWSQNDEFTLNGLIYICIGIVTFIFIKGFCNIIELLDSINSKLDK